MEDVPHCHTVERVVDLIGRGQLSVCAAADIARSVASRLYLIPIIGIGFQKDLAIVIPSAW